MPIVRPCLVAGILVVLAAAASAQSPYPWLESYDPATALVHRFPAREGHARVKAATGTFAHWLRHLPLKPEGTPVLLHNGNPKVAQHVAAAVLHLDVGEQDLQQCADSVIRLRAEYLFSCNRGDEIHFNFTSGDRAAWTDWQQGLRPQVDGNRVTWEKSGRAGKDRALFRQYLDRVFTYAGSYSLQQELEKVEDVEDLRAGDVYIQGGFPGHAIIVVDVAVQGESGTKQILIAQSYMPAQEVHVLRNLVDKADSPWHRVPADGSLDTPEWEFPPGSLYRFRESDR